MGVLLRYMAQTTVRSHVLGTITLQHKYEISQSHWRNIKLSIKLGCCLVVARQTGPAIAETAHLMGHLMIFTYNSMGLSFGLGNVIFVQQMAPTCLPPSTCYLTD